MTKNDAPASAGRSLLDGHLAGFSRWLEERGYAASTVEQYRVIVGRFDRYLTDHATDIRHLDEGHLEAYLKQIEPRRPQGRKAVVAEYYRRAGRRLIEYLRQQGVAAAPAQTAPGPAILCDYLSFLSDHRALATASIAEHERWLQRLFAHLGWRGEAAELRALSLSQIDGFLIAATQGFKRVSVGHGCAAIRGFLRYLYLRGILPRDLREQVATPRLYSLEDVPRALDWTDVERTLAAVDRKDVAGKRNHAILTVLAYCGLRAGEVAALRVDDIDWRHDTMRVRRRKCDTHDALAVAADRRRGTDGVPRVQAGVGTPRGISEVDRAVRSDESGERRLGHPQVPSCCRCRYHSFRCAYAAPLVRGAAAEKGLSAQDHRRCARPSESAVHLHLYEGSDRRSAFRRA